MAARVMAEQRVRTAFVEDLVRIDDTLVAPLACALDVALVSEVQSARRQALSAAWCPSWTR